MPHLLHPRRWSGFLVSLLLVILSLDAAPLRAEAFRIRGYYLTFMRMPAMGLPEWKQTVDCFAASTCHV